MKPAENPPGADVPARPAVSLVPPRPNLGPEPLEVGRPAGVWLLVLATALAVVVAGGLWVAYRRRQRRRETRRADGLPGSGVDQASEAQAIVALSETVRTALAERFGPAWLAKTTEEIAAEPGLSETFSADEIDRILSLLREADRLKFAGPGPVGSATQGDDVAAWSDFVPALFGRAGARSRTTGR